jgi:hypothetical protein
MILRETVWEGVDWIHLTRDWNQWLAEWLSASQENSAPWSQLDTVTCLPIF